MTRKLIYSALILCLVLLCPACGHNTDNYDEDKYWTEYAEQLAYTLNINLPDKAPDYCADESFPRALHVLIKYNLTDEEAYIFDNDVKSALNWQYLEDDDYIAVARIADFFDEIPVSALNNSYYCVFDKLHKEYRLPDDAANCKIRMEIYDVSNKVIYLIELST